MTMVLGDLLAMIRQDYLDTLRAVAYEAAAQGQTVVLEPQATPAEPALGVVAWHDLARQGKAVTVTSEGVFAFPNRIRFGWGDPLPGQPEPLQVVVQPFAWDAMPITLQTPRGQVLNLTPLAQWLAQWGAEPDSAAQAEDVFGREVVHSLRQTGPATWVADLGTAPLEAWQDLLEALLAAGASQAIFGAPQG
ncbi:MAG: hypothetical protein INF43_04030 [Alphaproteobacteria bacterium]|jgi:hypothetical protein|nr:hypothetical protein [Alphaproteobacteria bacterium]